MFLKIIKRHCFITIKWQVLHFSWKSKITHAIFVNKVNFTLSQEETSNVKIYKPDLSDIWHNLIALIYLKYISF